MFSKCRMDHKKSTNHDHWWVILTLSQVICYKPWFQHKCGTFKSLGLGGEQIEVDSSKLKSLLHISSQVLSEGLLEARWRWLTYTNWYMGVGESI